MLVLGIDPGSVTTGWALLKTHGKKISYVASGVLSFNRETQFIERLSEIKSKIDQLIGEITPDEIALESLIYVKSPTALIKLAQTRGIILSSFVTTHKEKIYEYSPNLVKSTAVGHGHADKESVRKFLDMMIGKKNYTTHDESDAVAVALCHILNKDKNLKMNKNKAPKKGRSLKSSLAHRIG